MSVRIVLPLRDHGHEVEIVRVDGEPRPVLGRAVPEEEDRRAATLRRLGVPASPRAQAPATIDLPLDRRTQTILSHSLAEPQRRLVDTGMGDLAGSRVRGLPGAVETAILGREEPDAG